MNHGEEENATMAIAPRTSRTACTEFRDTMALWKTRVSTRWFNQTWWYMVIYPANMVNNVDLKIKQYKTMDVTNGISGCGFVWNCWVYLRQVAFFKKDTLFFFPHLDFGDIIISMQNIQCTYSSAGTLENWFTISKCWCSRRFKEIVAKFFLVKLWLYNILYSI